MRKMLVRPQTIKASKCLLNKNKSHIYKQTVELAYLIHKMGKNEQKVKKQDEKIQEVY
jgi:hypothetical protein